MTTTVRKQILIRARTLIADSAHWTSGTLARNADGHHIDWYDQSAAKWCAIGAIYRAAYDLVGDPKEAARIGDEVINYVCPPQSSLLRGYLPTLNDQRGHAAVLAVFDKALQAA